jgi:hypothetical protein
LKLNFQLLKSLKTKQKLSFMEFKQLNWRFKEIFREKMQNSLGRSDDVSGTLQSGRKSALLIRLNLDVTLTSPKRPLENLSQKFVLCFG